MVKTKRIKITELDSGYLVNIDGKSQAIESTTNLQQYLSRLFMASIDRIDHAAVKNMSIEIAVEENVTETLPG